MLLAFHVQIVIRIKGEKRNKTLDFSLLVSHFGSLSNRLMDFMKSSEQ